MQIVQVQKIGLKIDCLYTMLYIMSAIIDVGTVFLEAMKVIIDGQNWN